MVCPCLGGFPFLLCFRSVAQATSYSTVYSPTLAHFSLLFFPAPLENPTPLLLKQRNNRKRITHSHLWSFPSGGQALSEGSEMAWDKATVGTLQERGLFDGHSNAQTFSLKTGPARIIVKVVTTACKG